MSIEDIFLFLFYVYYLLFSFNIKEDRKEQNMTNFCTAIYKCDSFNRYRSFDGSCNNLIKPWIGMRGTPVKRLLPPHYDNKNSSIRSKSFDGSNLTNPRIISLMVHFPVEQPGPLTLFAVIFGQLMTHDMAASDPIKKNGTFIDCSKDVNDTECVNIPTPPEDKINSDQPYMAFSRTAGLYIDWDCKKSQREQINQMTHWLDLSVLYGSDENISNSLRAKKDGLLRTSKLEGFTREFLPLAPNNTCVHETEKKKCFQSGESRVNQNFILTSIQTLFLREHNRIAILIKKLKSQFSDEQIFQVARRLVIAEYQHIIFNEWLPLIIGKRNMELFSLNPQTMAHSKSYDSLLNMQLYNEFLTAAFRFGHSMVKSSIPIKNINYETKKIVFLNNITANPTEAYQGEGIDGICRASFTENSNLCDSHFTDTMHDHLFEIFGTTPITKRLSIDSLNIQRGRDHGLQPYVKYRELCGFPKAKEFKDLKEIPVEVLERLKTVYNNVNDIDLYSGGVSETPFEGATVGPTFACIISKQFKELKYGDRYYYENEGFSTIAELDEIRKVTIARIICDNLDVSFIPNSPFLPFDKVNNTFVNCSQIPNMDLSKFNF